MWIAIACLVCLAVGAAGGYFWHASSAKVEAATKADLNNWTSRLETMVTADVSKVRAEAASIATEMRAKL